MIALVVIGIVASGVFSYSSHPRARSKRTLCLVDISNLSFALTRYEEIYVNFPNGRNAEKIKSLCGNNPQRIVFVSVSPNQLNLSGEQIDPWGTPYIIDLSATSTFVITSAGEDRVLGNSDDLVFNSISNSLVRP